MTNKRRSNNSRKEEKGRGAHSIQEEEEIREKQIRIEKRSDEKTQKRRADPIIIEKRRAQNIISRRKSQSKSKICHKSGDKRMKPREENTGEEKRRDETRREEKDIYNRKS